MVDINNIVHITLTFSSHCVSLKDTIVQSRNEKNIFSIIEIFFFKNIIYDENKIINSNDSE